MDKACVVVLDGASGLPVEGDMERAACRDACVVGAGPEGVAQQSDRIVIRRQRALRGKLRCSRVEFGLIGVDRVGEFEGVALFECSPAFVGPTRAASLQNYQGEPPVAYRLVEYGVVPATCLGKRYEGGRVIVKHSPPVAKEQIGVFRKDIARSCGNE